MKCLLCGYAANGVDDIREHYINYHRINKNNFFFQQLTQNQNGFLNSDCVRCQKVMPTKRFMAKHNFLEHYIVGEKKPAEFKRLDIIKNKEIIIYQITFEKHSNEYDCYNSHEIVDDFLLNVKRLLKPKDKVFFKGDFSIENIQNAPLISPNIADIKNTRYWSTDVYEAIYFNDVIISEIRSDILKRAINNNLTGSSRHFNRFKHLNIKVTQQEHKVHH